MLYPPELRAPRAHGFVRQNENTVWSHGLGADEAKFRFRNTATGIFDNPIERDELSDYQPCHLFLPSTEGSGGDARRIERGV